MPARPIQSMKGILFSVQTGDWKGGCLAKGMKFPTINLRSNRITRASDSSKSSNTDVEEIRINRYYGVKRDRFYVKNSGTGS
jgi:hypothetical protein